MYASRSPAPTSPQEEAFLTRLRDGLGQPQGQAQSQGRSPDEGQSQGPGQGQDQTPTEFAAQADALATAPLQADTTIPEVAAAGQPVPHPAAVDALVGTAAQRRPGTLSATDMDRKILNASIVNGAIELLPENLSTLAIIPLQMRLVYQIGQSYGYELDSGHIKDLLATLGVGLTSQYLEQAGRKLLSGMLGKAGKRLLGGLGRQAVSSGMSFASTYALGHVANQYYAGGRTLGTQMLRDAYQHVMADGRQLQPQYLPQMQEMARGLDTAKILKMVRGG